MLSTEDFGELLKKRGFDFYCGVPCSFLKSLINYAINDCEYVMSSNEGDAVATCAGAYLGGKNSIILCQNSGLTNATSPLISLTYTFQIPILGIVSLRGEKGLQDEPQHELMGQITTKFLDDMQIKWEYLSGDINEVKGQVDMAVNEIAKNKTFFFVVKKNTFDKVELKSQKLKERTKGVIVSQTSSDQSPQRYDALKTISDSSDNDTLYLATTGHTGRELYEINDKANNLYMVGSMGCISSLGLGLALSKPEKKIIVIDGDGALLMRLGAIATNAYYTPSNLLHILLDNNSHASTGGQATVSHFVDFTSCLSSVGYPKVYYVHNVSELKEYINNWKANPELTFLYMKIAEGSIENLGRPSIKPYEVKERFINFLQNPANGV